MSKKLEELKEVMETLKTTKDEIEKKYSQIEEKIKENDIKLSPLNLHIERLQDELAEVDPKDAQLVAEYETQIREALNSDERQGILREREELTKQLNESKSDNEKNKKIELRQAEDKVRATLTQEKMEIELELRNVEKEMQKQLSAMENFKYEYEEKDGVRIATNGMDFKAIGDKYNELIDQKKELQETLKYCEEQLEEFRNKDQEAVASINEALKRNNNEQPVVEETVKKEPTIEQPVVEEPVKKEPETKQPVVEEPAKKEPETKQPVVEEPVKKDPETKQPAAEEPAKEESAAEKPAAEEPAKEEPATEQPAVEEPAKEESAAEQPNAEESEKEKEKKSKEATKAIIARMRMAINEMKSLGLTDEQIKGVFYPNETVMVIPEEKREKVSEIKNKYRIDSIAKAQLTKTGYSQVYRNIVNRLVDSATPAKEQPKETKVSETARTNTAETTPNEVKNTHQNEDIKKLSFYISKDGSYMKVDRENTRGSWPAEKSFKEIKENDLNAEVLKQAKAIGDKNIIAEISGNETLSSKEKEEQLKKYTDLLRGEYTNANELPFELNYFITDLRRPEGVSRKEFRKEKKNILDSARKVNNLNKQIEEETGVENALGTVDAHWTTRAKWSVQDVIEKIGIGKLRDKAKNRLSKRNEPRQIEDGTRREETANKMAKFRKEMAEAAQTTTQEQPAATVDQNMSNQIEEAINEAGDR